MVALDKVLVDSYGSFRGVVRLVDEETRRWCHYLYYLKSSEQCLLGTVPWCMFSLLQVFVWLMSLGHMSTNNSHTPKHKASAIRRCHLRLLPATPWRSEHNISTATLELLVNVMFSHIHKLTTVDLVPPWTPVSFTLTSSTSALQHPFR